MKNLLKYFIQAFIVCFIGAIGIGIVALCFYFIQNIIGIIIGVLPATFAIIILINLLHPFFDD